MAFKKNKKKPKMYRKKYSYNERRNYHSSRSRAFVDKFRRSTGPNSSTIDFDEYEKALKKNKSIQYSDGFSDYMSDSDRNYFMSSDDLKKKTPSYQKGWKNAQKIDKQSRNIKL